MTQALELHRFYQDKIAECDREIAAQLERFKDRSDGEPPAPNGKKRNQKNAPRFDAQGQLYRMTGVDLTRIDGVDAYTALKVISEIGTDMTKWPSAKHFASWLGLSPNNRITGGRVMSSKTKPSANRAAAALRLAANALHRSDSALGAFLRRKKAHLGVAQGHHRHGPQAGSQHLFHAALRPGVRGRRGRILRTSISAAGVARRQAPGGATGIPTGTNVRRRGPHHVRTSRRANRRVTTLVSGEQRYGRGRPVQRRLTGQSASAVYTLARRVVRTKTEQTLVHIARSIAWSGSFTTTSLVTPRCGAIPLDRLCVADHSLRRHAYAVRRASRCVKTPVSG